METLIINRDDISAWVDIDVLKGEQKGKVELSKDLVLNSNFYCDDIDLNMMMGTPANLDLTVDCIRAEIGEVFSDAKLTERNEQEMSIYSSEN